MVSFRQFRLLSRSLRMPLLSLVLLASGCGRPANHVAHHEGPTSPQAKPDSPLEASSVKALADFNRGAAQLEQYQYAEAAKTFESVVTAFPSWTAARFNLGLALLNMPDADNTHDRAITELKRVIDTDSKHLPAHFNLGVLANHRGDFEQALDHFRKVYVADPDDPFVGYEYAETLRKSDRNDEARQVLEKVVERDPGFVSAFYSLGMIYNQSRQRDKARPDLETVLRAEARGDGRGFLRRGLAVRGYGQVLHGPGGRRPAHPACRHVAGTARCLLAES